MPVCSELLIEALSYSPIHKWKVLKAFCCVGHLIYMKMHFLKPALKNKRSFNNHVMKTTDNYECIHWVFRPWFREILYDTSFLI